MIYLNVSFGIYALMPQGWLFMIVIVTLESLIMSETLGKTASNIRISDTVIVSNVISGITGVIISMGLNGGWWLVIWIPWVSDNEVRIDTEFETLMYYYLFAFILTIFIESIINVIFLYKKYKAFRVLIVTLFANVVSYFIGSLILYSFSFG